VKVQGKSQNEKTSKWKNVQVVKGEEITEDPENSVEAKENETRQEGNRMRCKKSYREDMVEESMVPRRHQEVIGEREGVHRHEC
jgi:hypothetical protein